MIDTRRVLHDRLGHLLELVADEPDNDRWAEQVLHEVDLALDLGETAYARYVDRLDAMGAELAPPDEMRLMAAPEDYTMTDVIERLARVEGKLTALIARTGPAEVTP